MSQKTDGRAAIPHPGKSTPAPLPKPQNQPTEPTEVLGRHKNDGQKDHKGAR